MNPVTHPRCRAVGLLVAAQALVGCAAIRSVEAGGAADPVRIHEVTLTRTAVIPGTPEQVFAFIAAEDVLPRLLTGYGPLPAVVRTSEHTGAWDVPGSARLIHLADGSTVREQVTQFASPSRFAYRVWAFGHPVLRTLATQARGEWTFVAHESGTAVAWTYTFTARNAVAAWPLSAITRWLWRGYMDVCLDNAVRLMASQAPST